MNSQLAICLLNSSKTAFCGQSLALSLYRFPLTILCRGPLGAGKTTFLQGFARGLGISESITSPTFALEQHYRTASGKPFVHIDLYRLTGEQARELLHTTEDHEGIRCIEWAERIDPSGVDDAAITIEFREMRQEREISITFNDVPLPSVEQIERWCTDVRLPQHIIDHCEGVSNCAVRLGRALVEQGQVVRLDALERAGQVHDLFRFIDFRDGAGPENWPTPAPEDVAAWQTWINRFHAVRADMKHEEACARFLREKQFDALASIVEAHGLKLPPTQRSTTEQKLLYYADKRVRGATPVTLQERFKDFRARYSGGKDTELSKKWYEEALKVEKELFPEGIPF